MALGSFDTRILAEDTELTFRLLMRGWKVIYANRAECYEEAPETWDVRARQIRRWSRGHNQVMFRYLWQLIVSSHLSKEKIDGLLLSSCMLSRWFCFWRSVIRLPFSFLVKCRLSPAYSPFFLSVLTIPSVILLLFIRLVSQRSSMAQQSRVSASADADI